MEFDAADKSAVYDLIADDADISKMIPVGKFRKQSIVDVISRIACNYGGYVADGVVGRRHRSLQTILASADEATINCDYAGAHSYLYSDTDTSDEEVEKEHLPKFFVSYSLTNVSLMYHELCGALYRGLRIILPWCGAEAVIDDALEQIETLKAVSVEAEEEYGGYTDSDEAVNKRVTRLIRRRKKLSAALYTDACRHRRRWTPEAMWMYPRAAAAISAACAALSLPSELLYLVVERAVRSEVRARPGTAK